MFQLQAACAIILRSEGQHRPISAEPEISACAGFAADALLATALDEVAWLTNLRGSDVDYNPVFTSYFLLTAQAATLYVAGSKANPNPEMHPFDACATPFSSVQVCCATCVPTQHRRQLDWVSEFSA